MYKHPQGLPFYFIFLVDRAGEKGLLSPWPPKGHRDY